VITSFLMMSRLRHHYVENSKNYLIIFSRIASLCKEMNLQGKANGRKVVVFGKVRNLQGTENPRKYKLESARKGNCKEWNMEGNGICTEWNLQGIEFARNGICK